MAYLILADQQGEFDRRELKQAVVVGRALDCDICVRDILLSRKHCRIEPFNDRWVVCDLGSKNGTRIGNEVVTKHMLSDGEVVRIGKIQVCFRTGAFVPIGKSEQRRRDVRPTDPTEALSGTVLGFQLFDMEEDSRVSGFPIPKPKPPEPVSLREQAVTAMVTEMASKSWDAALSEKKTASKSPARPVRKPAQRPQPMAAAPPKVSEAKPVVQPAEAPVATVVRRETPARPATIPGWLAGAYILLACAVGVTAIGVVVMRSNPSLNWLAR